MSASLPVPLFRSDLRLVRIAIRIVVESPMVSLVNDIIGSVVGSTITRGRHLTNHACETCLDLLTPIGSLFLDNYTIFFSSFFKHCFDLFL